MSRKITLKIKAEVIVNVDGSLEIEDAISLLEIRVQYKGTDFSVVDYEIKDYEVIDSK